MGMAGISGAMRAYLGLNSGTAENGDWVVLTIMVLLVVFSLGMFWYIAYQTPDADARDDSLS